MLLGHSQHQQLLQKPKDIPKFLEAMTLPVTHWTSPSGLPSSFCKLLAPTLALWRKLQPHIPSTFLPWPTLLPDIHTHHWSQGQWLPHHISNQRPPWHRVVCWHNMKIAVTAWDLSRIILPYIPIIVISQIVYVTTVHKIRKPCTRDCS